MAEISVSRVGPERIGDLERPYRALHLHHAQLAPKLGGMPVRAEAWARRRRHYEVWLRRPGAFAVLADNAGAIRFYRRHGLMPVVLQMLGDTH